MKKNFKVDIELRTGLVSETSSESNIFSTVINFPQVSTTSTRKLDFSNFYGKGYDDITKLIYKTLDSMLSDSIQTSQASISIATLATYGRNIQDFFKFLDFSIHESNDLTPDDIDKKLIAEFVSAINENDWTRSTKRSRLGALKSLLVYAEGKEFISNRQVLDIFPSNAFHGSKRNSNKINKKPLSIAEMKQVAKSLKAEMEAVVSSDNQLGFYELSICVMYISLRTGINLTPTLELSTDCIQPHPLKENLNLLVCFKRRGYSQQIHSLKKELKDSDTTAGISSDVSAVIDMIKERNSDIRSRYHDPSRLIVYEQHKKNTKDGIAGTLNQPTVAREVSNFARKHNLRCDDGNRLQLNALRLRKTFINRIWELSGHNPMVASRYGKHTLQIANKHYWEAPPESESNMRLLQEMRINELRVVDVTDCTPIAHCGDSKNGHRAPKNGSICTNILGCFRCKSFVVTEDDLYRLYSFYWAALKDQQTLQEKGWKKHMRRIICLIDQDIAPKFDDSIVAEKKEKARVYPHPFWKDLRMIRMAR